MDNGARSDGDLDDSSGTFIEGGLHLLGAEVKAVRESRAGMVAGLTPAKAKPTEDKGGGWRLKAGELGHESLGAVQLAEGSAHKSGALVVSDRTSGCDFGRMDV